MSGIVSLWVGVVMSVALADPLPVDEAGGMVDLTLEGLCAPRDETLYGPTPPTRGTYHARQRALLR